MIPVALYPIPHYFEKLGILSTIEVPKRIAQRSVLFSKGKVKLYQGEGINKFVNLSVKGFTLYHYDFGIVYPEKDYVYPIFFYQVIIAPQRILVLVHYAFNDLNKAEKLVGIEELLQRDKQYSELFIKEFKPQPFIVEDVIPNQFNGLVRTTDIDKAYEAIAELFQQWHIGMLQQGKCNSKAEIDSYQQWFGNFRSKFYNEDYGLISTKRYMGGRWSKEVFNKYLFDL